MKYYVFPIYEIMNKKKDKGPSKADRAQAALKHNRKQLAAVGGRSKPRPGRSNGRFTDQRRQRYLDALQEHGEPALARREVGVTYATIKNHQNKDSDFNEACQESMRIYRAKLAKKVHDRGYDGVQEPVYWNGMVVGWITKFSDRMLELQVKRHIPEYRDKVTVQNEHSGAIGLLADISELPAEIRGDLKKILEKVKGSDE